MKSDMVIGLAAAAGIILLGYKLSDSIGGAISSTGEGVENALSGAGSALDFSGRGVYELASGAGSGIEYIGEGVGYGVGSLGAGIGLGVANVGEGVRDLGGGIGAGVQGLGEGVGEGISQTGGALKAVGEGVGYGASGLNAQDLLQTLLTGGKGEASTYGTSSSLTSVNNSRSEDGVIPTAEKTLGLSSFMFNPIGKVASWVYSQGKSIISSSSPEIPAENSQIISNTIKTPSLKTSSVSSSGGGSSSRSVPSIFLAPRNEALEALGFVGTSTAKGVVYSSPTPTTTSTTSTSLVTKPWYQFW